MIFLSIAFFVVAMVAALFGFGLAADPEFAVIAQLVAGALFVMSVLLFSFDRAWGSYVLRRQTRVPQDRVDLERSPRRHFSQPHPR